MFSVYDSDRRTAFLIPFAVALACGLPVFVAWIVIAVKWSLVASITSILLALACGFGARKAAGGGHPLEAALISTLFYIIAGISIITMHVMAKENDTSMLTVIIYLIREGKFTDFANSCVWVAGQTFYSYIIALFVAGWISNDR